MSQADRLLKSHKTFRRLTGLTPDAFLTLAAEVAAAEAAARARRSSRPGRLRSPGAGRKHALDLADRLLALLIYYRAYTTHVFIGWLFGVDDSTVSRNNRALEPLLAGIFRIPERKPVLTEGDIEEFFFDATERPTNRPKCGQKAYYSGKKKRHTIKVQVVVVKRKKKPGPGAKPRRVRVAAVSPSFPGSVHDKKVYDETGAELPEGAKGSGDTAYKGTPLATPHKKPVGGELTGRQKAGNRRLSRRRVCAEHAIGKMKIWRVAAEKYRGKRKRHTLVMKNVAGLHNRMYA